MLQKAKYAKAQWKKEQSVLSEWKGVWWAQSAVLEAEEKWWVLSHLGDGEGWGGLACCSPWSHKESDIVTEQQQQWVLRLEVSCCSIAKSCLTLYDPMDYGTPSLPVSHYLLEFVQVHVHWIGDAIQPSHPLPPLLLLPSVFPSIRVFSNELALHTRWPKYWSFSFRISSSNEYSVLISFKADWFDLHAVQGTLKSLLQHLNSKASVLQCSAFFMVQLSRPYMTIRKTIVLTRWTFVGKVVSLLFHMLSRFVIAFLPRSKCLLISWLQSPSAVILEPKKVKSVTAYTFSLSICHEAMGLDAVILVFLMLSFSPAFSPSSFPLIKRLFNSSLLSTLE